MGNRPYNQSQGCDLVTKSQDSWYLSCVGQMERTEHCKVDGSLLSPKQKGLLGVWLGCWVNCPIVRTQAEETSRVGWAPRLPAGSTKAAFPAYLWEEVSPGDCMCS